MSNTDDTVGFLGLGALGMPIAENLLASGKVLTVWNRTASKAEALVAKGAKQAATPEAAVPRGGVVFTILWDDASLEEMVTPAFLEALGDGIHVSMTTVTPETSRKLAALHAKHGSTLVESPLFGIPAAAAARQITACVAGPAAAKERVRPLLEAMGASKIFDFGDVGAGTATKLVGNFMIVANFALLEEAFAILKASGVDPKPTLEMLTTTYAATPGNQRYVGYLLSDKPRPQSGIPEKDIGLFKRFAAAAHQSAPLATEVGAQLAVRSGGAAKT